MVSKSVAIIGTRGYPSYYGGFETLVRNLAPFLANNGWEVTVYGRKGATERDDPNADTRVRAVTTAGIESKSLSTLSYGLSSTIHAARRRPDVALIMNVANGYWVPFLRARGVPTVVNVDGIEWERAKWGRQAKAAFKIGAKFTARFADRLIFDSKEIGRRWSEEFDRRGDFIPYGATDLPSRRPIANLESGKYALLVARFVPENTIEQFFEAAQKISERWNVVIVGSSGYADELDARAHSLAASSPRIHWLGHISDDQQLFSLWQNAGAYFHGHSVGGTNPALVQAMACGAPTVARDTPYNREVLADAGIYVPPNSAIIAREIERVLANPTVQSDLRSRARKRQVTYYTWDGVCSAYESSLVAAISGSSLWNAAGGVNVRG